VPVSSDSEPGNEPSILRRFASLIGLLGVSLFFTGWIYRWVYYLKFHLEVTTLEFSVESFLIVPMQVLFADGRAIVRSNNEVYDPENPLRIWRLLLERDGWIYLLPTTPGEENPNTSPPVVAVPKSMYGDQLMILAPTFQPPELPNEEN